MRIAIQVQYTSFSFLPLNVAWLLLTGKIVTELISSPRTHTYTDTHTHTQMQEYIIEQPKGKTFGFYIKLTDFDKNSQLPTLET